MSNKIFLTRLFSYFIYNSRIQHGYIPDIIKILVKYKLEEYLSNFMTHGHFPSKMIWKSIVKNSVEKVQTENWLNRVNNQDDFLRFISIRKSVSIAKVFKTAKCTKEV